MASPATVTREEAAAQAAELQPKPPPAAEVAPRRAAPGSHPSVPVESDSEALAQYQGADQLPGGGDEVGCWKLDAWNRPVFVPGEPASSGGSASRRSLTEPSEEPTEPPGQRAEKRNQEEAVSPMEQRREAEKPGTAREAGQRGR